MHVDEEEERKKEKNPAKILTCSKSDKIFVAKICLAKCKMTYCTNSTDDFTWGAIHQQAAMIAPPHCRHYSPLGVTLPRRHTGKAPHRQGAISPRRHTAEVPHRRGATPLRCHCHTYDASFEK